MRAERVRSKGHGPPAIGKGEPTAQEARRMKPKGAADRWSEATPQARARIAMDVAKLRRELLAQGLLPPGGPRFWDLLLAARLRNLEV